MSQLDEALGVVLENTQDDCSVAILARTSEQLPPLMKLPLSERKSLYQIEGSSVFRRVRQKISRCDKICAVLEKPKTLRQFARKLRIKPRQAKRKLQRLLNVGLITQTDLGYQTYGCWQSLIKFFHIHTLLKRLWTPVLKDNKITYTASSGITADTGINYTGQRHKCQFESRHERRLVTSLSTIKSSTTNELLGLLW